MRDLTWVATDQLLPFSPWRQISPSVCLPIATLTTLWKQVKTGTYGCGYSGQSGKGFVETRISVSHFPWGLGHSYPNHRQWVL